MDFDTLEADLVLKGIELEQSTNLVLNRPSSVDKLLAAIADQLR